MVQGKYDQRVVAPGEQGKGVPLGACKQGVDDSCLVVEGGPSELDRHCRVHREGSPYLPTPFMDNYPFPW